MTMLWATVAIVVFAAAWASVLVAHQLWREGVAEQEAYDEWLAHVRAEFPPSVF